MNMISLPRPECPYCHEAMRRWPLGQHMLVCDTCRRPIVRYLAAPSRRIFRLRPLYSVINAIALFILVATFLAIVIARAGTAEGQAAYAELVFVPELWPDVDRVVLWRAITEYARRDRRYGGAVDLPGSDPERDDAPATDG